MTGSRAQLIMDEDNRNSMYEDISDGEIQYVEDEVPADNNETYATKTARGTSDGNDASSEDLSDSEVYPRRRMYGQQRYLSDFEKEHFHPLNVTLDRPCTAFFRADSELSGKDLFDSFIKIGIPANAVRCLQRKPTGECFVTFSTAEYCTRFLEKSHFVIRRSNYTYTTTHPAQTTLTYLTIYDAPYEMPDAAIEERLKPYCIVHSRRRGKLQGYSNILNGLGHYRVEILNPVPCYLRFGKFQLRFYHDDQTKTCRRCGKSEHIAKNCENQVCFN